VNVAVIGLGKIGFPLAVKIAEFHPTTGMDINAELIHKLSQGEEYLSDEPGVARSLETSGDNLKYSTSIDVPQDVYVITVPLGLSNGKADFRNLDSALEHVSKSITRGSLICLETTVPVGTTQGRVVSFFEGAKNWKVGEDFFVVFSPERVQTGTYFLDLQRYPKIVSGVDPQSLKKGVDFYRSFLRFELDGNELQSSIMEMSTTSAAEFTKLAESVYRDVNIALANELFDFGQEHQLEFAEILSAANSQKQSNIHKPGVFVGGHCIPVYPHLMLEQSSNLPIVKMARELNDSRPLLVIEFLKERFSVIKGLKVALLGLAYRPGVPEISNSGCVSLYGALRDLGAVPSVHDPLFSLKEIEKLGFNSVNFEEASDVVILLTAHAEYLNYTSERFIGFPLIIDGRGVWHPSTFPKSELKYFGSI
jgi:UDP-N-acetyl-D-glucosamine dehydrogenase